MAKPFVRVAALQQNQAIVDKDGKPNPFFMRALNDTLINLGEAINALAALPIIQQQLGNLDAAVAAAQAAADDAIAAAGNAQGAAEGAALEQALVNSFIDPNTVTSSTDTVITVIDHNRVYADAAETTVFVNGASIAAPGPGAAYIYYNDPTRAGGNVTYIASAVPVTQTGDRHVVEAVFVPATGQPPANGGGGPVRPGNVEP